MSAAGWSTPEHVRAQLRRRWDDGSLPRAYLKGEPFPRVEVPLRGPTATELAQDLTGVGRWRTALLEASANGAAFSLQHRAVGGRSVGRNELPSRAVVEQYEQAWRLLGVARQARALDEALAETRELLPQAEPWVLREPLRVIGVSADWQRILRATRWVAERGAGRYLREIDLDGIDTKFIETNLSVIAALLDAVMPTGRISSERSRTRQFAERYGLQSVPDLVRIRCDAGFLGLPSAVSELALRPEEAARLQVAVQQVLIVENLVTYAAVPIPAEGVVIWGAGFSAGRLGRMPWMRSAPSVAYAGDLDSHGFAILSLVRSQLPHTRSMLMDRSTLLQHRDRWGRDPKPTRARLDHLLDDEQQLYQELVEDVHAPSLRLEQERLDWDWVLDRLEAQ